MLVSIFGKVEYGDTRSIDTWAKAHEIAHRSLVQVLLKQGNVLQTPVLMQQQIDNQWFGHHGMIHLGLLRFYTPDQTSSASLMLTSLADWLSADKFYDWHRMHDAIHTRLNTALGVH